MRNILKQWKLLAAALVLVVLLMQLIPVDRTNPAVGAEPTWDSPQTRDLAKAACFDCHSNETVWPWYSKVAPMAWLVARDVDEGRSKMNFSEWDTRSEDLDEIIEVIDSGEMPPAIYTPLHADARLSDDEKQQLIDGFRATLNASGEAGDTSDDSAAGDDDGENNGGDEDDD